MTYYGQENYNQELGNGSYTIAEAGCFLTSFANLLAFLGIQQIAPPSLNNWFLANGDYIKDPDGGKEDLAWNSITHYNPNIVCTKTGTSAIPPSTPAIVKFYYQSISHPWLNAEKTQPNMIDHFCMVSKIVGNVVYIIDSYDGIEKSAAQYQTQYHAPVGWATYEYNVPVPAPPAASTTTPAAPISIPGNTQDKYQVLTILAGYRSSSQAASRSGENSQVPIGSYFVFNRANSMLNITRVVGQPGWWINPADNVLPAKQSASGPQTYTVVKSIPGYMTSNEAVNHISPNVTVAAGTYYVYSTYHGAINVTRKQGAPGSWINPSDNEANGANAAGNGDGSGAPLDWQATYAADKNNYIAKQTITVDDIAKQKQSLTLKQYTPVAIAGTFTGPDDVLYGRTPTSVKNGWWYGIPMTNLELEDEVFNTQTNTASRKATNNLKPRDYLVISLAKIKGVFEKGKK